MTSWCGERHAGCPGAEPAGKRCLSRAAQARAGARRVWREGNGAAGPRALQQAAVPEAVAVAVADDARLHKRAAAGHRDRVRVVVAQVEVACRARAHARAKVRVSDTLPTPADDAQAWPAKPALVDWLPACGLSRARAHHTG